MDSPRIVARNRHDDGIDAWGVVRATPGTALAGAVRGYASYWERTASFTARRELASTAVVLIVNLGDVLELCDGRGDVLRLGPGEGFVAGIHTATAISRSTGTQAGVHVFLTRATLSRLLGMPLEHLLNRCVDLEAVLGPGIRSLCQRLGETADAQFRFALLERAIIQRLAEAPAPDAAMLHAERRLASASPPPVAALAAELDLSRQHFARRFRETTGRTAPTAAAARLWRAR
ncbi:hypothetical protein [Sphingomonas sanxanigenens]|uniref:HTH araC/xylS-type domain-containing protein n=1 Tax=Sphingomonas sanxanigenens DSM 19645 = NX02 TaxID=1123269 RepID=W0AKP3_9SPHN|nr:hypothetical protein [Sphingomonas sanxanigenens]AHE56255.1 hypothetical protein NX02_23195 [Sphingomonas sanxanigenens DSM 19645 = NX02]